MAATYFIEECNRRSTHAGHTYGILKLKGILWPGRLFIFSTAKRGCVPVAQTSTTCVAIWSFERQPHE